MPELPNMISKLGRIPQKLLVRFTSRRNSFLLNVQRISIFLFIVVLLSICKSFVYQKSDVYAPEEQNTTIHQLPEDIRSDNSSDITIGGIKVEKDECTTKILQTLPKYAVDYCKNHTESCSSLTCLDVLTDNINDKHDSVIKSIILPEEVEQKYIDLTRDCDTYKREAGYKLSPLSEESKNFSIAFNILIHNKVRQFELLMKTLYRPQNFYCIHVDSKASPNFRKAVKGISECFDNVFLSSRSEPVTWAGISRLQADITCMRDHLYRNNKWKYLINTVGLAYPIKTNEEMVRILKIYNGANDIEGIYGERVLRSRFVDEWIESKETNRLIKTGRKNPKPPHNIDIVRGSAYGIFSREFVYFITTDRKAIDLLEWSRSTWSPDEFYWATLHHTYSNPHLNPPGGFSGYPMAKEWLAVYANWGDEPCHGMWMRGVCVLGVKDIKNLVGRKEFFVNKFLDNFQSLALSCLATWIKYKETCNVPFDDTFYRNLKFIKKDW